MNAEKVLTWATAAAGHLKQGANGNAAEILEYLKTEAETEIRREAAKASGNGNRQKAAERVIKSAISNNPQRVALHGAWNANNKQYICDAFRIFCFPDALPLQQIPENVEPIDAERIIKNAAENNGAKLPLPSIAELKAYIKTEKARKKAIKDNTAPTWNFGDGLPLVNALYLFDALEILPECTATTSSRSPLIAPIYFESVHGCGILCPVRKEV